MASFALWRFVWHCKIGRSVVTKSIRIAVDDEYPPTKDSQRSNWIMLMLYSTARKCALLLMLVFVWQLMQCFIYAPKHTHFCRVFVQRIQKFTVYQTYCSCVDPPRPVSLYICVCVCVLDLYWYRHWRTHHDSAYQFVFRSLPKIL